MRGALLAAARAGGAAAGARGEGRAAAQPGARRRRGGDALQDGLPPGQQVSRGWHTPGARPARGEPRAATARPSGALSRGCTERRDAALLAQPGCPVSCASKLRCFGVIGAAQGEIALQTKHSCVPAALQVCTEVKTHPLVSH